MTASTTQLLASVIIPAHDEADVIGATLRSVLASTIADDVEVLVVCNGCRDATAEVAAATSPDVRVLESDVAAKHAALDLGDRHARGRHRVYLDADTTVSPGALEAVVALLDEPGVEAASPEIHFATDHCSWPARQFHRIWWQSPYYRRTTLGAGFYALSPAGRARFDRFPPAVGDDYFVSGLIALPDRRTAVGHTYSPVLPATVRSMVRVHVRHYGAHAQLDEWWLDNGGGDRPGEPEDGYRWLAPLAANPANWPGLGIYVAVKAVAVVLGRRKNRQRAMGEWNRDEAGRRAAHR